MDTIDPRSEAIEAYRKYRDLAKQCTEYEKRALREIGNKSMAQYQLKTHEGHWDYRNLCNERDLYMAIANMNANMATMLAATRS